MVQQERWQRNQGGELGGAGPTAQQDALIQMKTGSAFHPEPEEAWQETSRPSLQLSMKGGFRLYKDLQGVDPAARGCDAHT